MPDPKYTLTQVLQDKWWVGVVSFAIALVVTPIVRRIAYRYKIVDRPDDLLKPHGRPIAYLGGLAMCVGLLAGLAIYLIVMPEASRYWNELGTNLADVNLGSIFLNPVWNLLFFAIAAVVITVVGLLDDLRNLKPRTKVLGQVIAAGILLVGGIGLRTGIVLFSVPTILWKFFGATPPEWIIAPPMWLLAPISVVVTVVLVIAACNATNLLDGLDGLCGGVTGIISLGFLALATYLAVYGWPGHEGYDALRMGIALAMAGAVFGFLPYNVPPASIFMGDAGSMLLGFFVAVMMALFCREHNPRWFIAACAVFALPILDTALAVVRRLLARKNIFAGDRSHLYDQLVDRGMTVKQVVALFYVLAILAALIGVLAAIFLRTRHAAIFYLVLLIVIWTVFGVMGMIKPPPHPSKPQAGTPPADEGGNP